MPGNKTTIKLSDHLKIGEVAQLLGVTTTTLRRWDKAGLLSPTRHGSRRDRRYSKDEILEILSTGFREKI